MAVELHVYDVANAVKLGELTKAHGIGGFDDLRDPGTMIFAVDRASTVDRALLEHFRVVRVNIDGTDVFAYVVQDTPATLAAVDERPFVSFQCRHLLTWLGYKEGGAVLWPYGGLSGLQQSPRWFGPMSFDFPDVTVPEPTTGGQVTRAAWPDPRAERFVFDDRAVYRRFLTGSAGHLGPSRMIFTAAHWTEARVWLDGAEISALSKPVGETSVRSFDLPYDEEDHVVCIDARGTPPAGAQNSLAWTWAELVEDENGDFDRLGGRLFTTFNSTTYSGPTAPTAPYWQAWEDYTEYPGVTVGFVAGVALDEAQDRGLLPGVTKDFDDDEDSDGVPWVEEFARAFRTQKLGPLLDSLAPFQCEPEMTPTGLLRLHQARGVDRTGTVTVTTPYALSSTGRGPQATRYLYETEGGFGELVNAARETALGVKLEDVAQLGEDLDPDTIAAALEAQLEKDAATYHELDIDLPSNLKPYGVGMGVGDLEVELGDLVLCESDADGTVATVRLTSFRWIVDDANGHLSWSAHAELVS